MDSLRDTLSELSRDGFEVVVHPAGNQPPVCGLAERKIQEARQHEITTIVPLGRVFIMLANQGGRKGLCVVDRARLELSRLVQANALVAEDPDDPLCGCLVNSLGEDRFLLGRPVRDHWVRKLSTEITTLPSIIGTRHDLSLWTEAKNVAGNGVTPSDWFYRNLRVQTEPSL